MSARFTHGLVVGKFYPPHVGHLRLITAAAKRCDRVSVVVSAASWESLDLGRRVEWLGWHAASLPHVAMIGVLNDYPINYQDPAAWDAHMAVFVAAANELAPSVTIDVVFTGENYGTEMAHRLGVEHVRLIRPRLRPSGTALRANLSAAWDDLLPAARVGLARRIVVVGAESTGTTTLARALADHFTAGFVPEYGRIWSAAKLAEARARSGNDPIFYGTSFISATSDASDVPGVGDLVWTTAEFTWIAARQTAEIDRAAIEGPLVVADTDALATSVWHDRYVGGSHQPALDLAVQNRPDLYLLTTPAGVPFVDDGLRDGEHLRGNMTHAFEAALDSGYIPWASMSGNHATRLADSIQLVENLLAKPRFPDQLSNPETPT